MTHQRSLLWSVFNCVVCVGEENTWDGGWAGKVCLAGLLLWGCTLPRKQWRQQLNSCVWPMNQLQLKWALGQTLSQKKKTGFTSHRTRRGSSWKRDKTAEHHCATRWENSCTVGLTSEPTCASQPSPRHETWKSINCWDHLLNNLTSFQFASLHWMRSS